jgi:hypothetical protein
MRVVMRSVFAKRFVQLTPVIAALALVMIADRPVAAQGGCFQGLRECYFRAANINNFWDMWLAGIDCELDFADCSRRTIIGR